MAVLITGGAGYIGSHTVVQLQQAGEEVVVLDNLCNSNPEVFNRIEKLTGKRPLFQQGDIRDENCLKELFKRFDFDSVIHFAGLKAVGESVKYPLRYYRNNVEGSLLLFSIMAETGCKKLVFSSSATVYGDPATVPIKEDFPLAPTNPYGQSKYMVEKILQDMAAADTGWQIALLRYFNPVGAHPSGLIGEDPNGIPNNLMPFVAQVAVEKQPYLNVFGADYSTADGTGVRDYIHVMDLANGHLKALEVLSPEHGCQIYNLGTGTGYSVLQIIAAFAKASGQEIPYKVVDRRSGDIATCFADPTFSIERLGWSAKLELPQMVEDHWRWQKNNPNGYATE